MGIICRFGGIIVLSLSSFADSTYLKKDARSFCRNFFSLPQSIFTGKFYLSGE
jgi:hypothetical protein